MKLIKIEEARPGSKVARDVTDLRGNMLFKAGTELSLELIEKIRSRNVTHLFVEDEAAVTGSKSAEDIVKMQVLVEAELDGVFSDVVSNPVMMELRESAKRYFRSRIV